MSDVFTVDAPDGIPEGEIGPPMQLWWGRLHGEWLGLMTDQFGGVIPDAADRTVLCNLGRTGSLIKCLGQDGAASVAGIDPRRSLEFLSDELEPLRWDQHTTIRIDGHTVNAVTLTHRGLEFAAGEDFLTYPFVLIRLQGGSPPWPDLRTVAAPEYPP